jgi:hypothetical protein
VAQALGGSLPFLRIRSFIRTFFANSHHDSQFLYRALRLNISAPALHTSLWGYTGFGMFGEELVLQCSPVRFCHIESPAIDIIEAPL